MKPSINEDEPESNRNPLITCPVQCSKPSLNTFCVKPVRNAQCDNAEEECCLESESSIDSMTKDLIKLVQQSIALNETKHIGAKFDTTTSVPTTSALPPCDGTCVVPLFSILCDEVDNNQFCPNGGSCCVNREQTTSQPPIPACEGTCIPVVLSGMCNKPYELVLKTVDCASGTICCADNKSDSDEQLFIPNEPHKDVPIEQDKNLLGQSTYIGRPVIRPMHPPAQLMPPQMATQFNQYNPNAFLSKPNQNVMPIPPMHAMHPKPKPSFGHHNNPNPAIEHSVFHPNPNHVHMPDKLFIGPHIAPDQANNIKPNIRPHLPEGIDSKPSDDKKPLIQLVNKQVPINKEIFACPANCMNNMFR